MASDEKLLTIVSAIEEQEVLPAEIPHYWELARWDKL
jgi:hypothetical protein